MPTMPCPHPSPQRSHGFTLIELLITLVCIALLTSLAGPSYQAWVLRSQRTQARVALLQAAHWLERSASANGSYPAAKDVPSSVLLIDGQHYQLSITSSAHTYTLSATPLGAQTADACGTLVITHVGERSVQGASQSAAQCWGR